MPNPCGRALRDNENLAVPVGSLERPAARDARRLRQDADDAVPVEVTRAIARNNRL